MSHGASVAASGGLTVPRWLVRGIDPPAVAAWLLPFAAILLLAFSGGGYDPIIRGQAGIVVWWTILVGAGVGSVAIHGGRVAWVVAGLFAAFLAWTALGLTWTQSAERTTAEVARVAMLLGVLLLGLAAQGRVAARHTINGAACAIALIAGAAVLSRLQPQLFPAQELDEIFPASRARLAYPLGYWNLLAGLVVMGVPLLMAAGGAARTTLGRAAATAALPLAGLCIFLTVSRGGLLAAAVAVPAFLLLAPDRLPKLAHAAVGGLGAFMLCLAADRREAVQQNLGDALARQQGDELLGLAVLVCVGVGLVAAGLALVDRHAVRPAWSRPPRRITGALTVALVAGAAVVAVLAGGADYAGDRIDEFKAPSSATAVSFDDAVSRLRSVAGNGRYQYWQVSEQAAAAHPLRGAGPGTFEFLWAQKGTEPGFIRNAHSLWFESLAEAGYVGLVLIVAFFIAVIGTGVFRALRAIDAEHRGALAAATAALVGFCVCASIEWAWQMTVLPAAAMLLAAVAVAGRAERPLRARTDALPVGPRPPQRVGLALLAVAALVAIGLPTAAAGDLRDSQRRAAGGDLQGAFDSARSAAALQPAAASPHLQKALVLERAGELDRALVEAREATTAEATNWRTWLVRSRLEARTGAADAALASYTRARRLNPRSSLFAR